MGTERLKHPSKETHTELFHVLIEALAFLLGGLECLLEKTDNLAVFNCADEASDKIPPSPLHVLLLLMSDVVTQRIRVEAISRNLHKLVIYLSLLLQKSRANGFENLGQGYCIKNPV